jgi:hypothetical protein
MPPEAMIAIGTTIYNFPMEEGAQATGLAHFQFDDTAIAGLIDAGTPLSVSHPSSQTILFVTVDDVAIAPNVTKDVEIIADATGSAANGAYGHAELIDPVQGLADIQVDYEADGGADPESPQEYLDRLSTNLTTLTPRPVLPNDHALLVSSNVPGIGRATAIDLLCPGTSTEPDAIRDPNELAYFQGKTPPQGIPTNNLTNEPRCTTVAITAEDGSAPSTQLMQEAWDYLDANREVNFLNYVISPDYTSIDVKGEIHPYPGYTAADAVASAQAMITAWLDPTTYGQPPGSTGKDWANDVTIRHDEAVDYMNRGAGVWWTRNIQLRVSGGSWTSGDITMGGLAALPMKGDLSGITAV